MVIVAFAGPPAVRLTDSSNSCKVPLMDMMADITMVGISSGTVIFQNVCQPLAPSILAASYTE